jgi:hypothetical protein
VFLTDLDGTAIELDKFHRHHAVVELAIRDLKHGAGLEHVPSGNFQANSAWPQCAVLAHSMIRWTAIAGKIRHQNQLVVARTLFSRWTVRGRVRVGGVPVGRGGCRGGLGVGGCACRLRSGCGRRVRSVGL